MVRPPAVLLALTLPGAVLAQSQAGSPPQRIRSVTLTGTQQCPKAASPDEVVVCSRLESPYRVPKELRNAGPIPEANQSWVNRTALSDQVGRTNGAVPNSCSPVGTAGQSGCAIQAGQAWAAERRAQKAEQASTPGGGQ